MDFLAWLRCYSRISKLSPLLYLCLASSFYLISFLSLFYLLFYLSLLYFFSCLIGGIPGPDRRVLHGEWERCEKEGENGGPLVMAA